MDAFRHRGGHRHHQHHGQHPWEGQDFGPFEPRMRRGWRMPFPPPWGGGPMAGPFGHGRRHGGRGGRRPNVRAAVLALLLDRPMHGYEMITELEARTGGVWRPSPGSVYPTLQLLEDEGLITGDESGGRKRFALTDEGRTEAERSGPAPWEGMGDEVTEDWHDLRQATFDAMHALQQVMTAGSDEQRRRAVEVIVESKRKLYAILAETE